uniref:Ig-like domain-containing protein n=1 Tax=Tetraodon nigroviridis TaxID=99883 RepID=H3BWM4_TETNG
YENRANISASGSLELRNLTVGDSGQYTVIISPRQQPTQQGAATLNVYVPVSGIALSQPGGDLVEPSSSVRLSCSSSGSSISFLWLNGTSSPSGRVHVADGGSALVVDNVTRYDQGPFRCHVFNPISNGTSDPVSLTINYGPEKVEIAGPPQIRLGQRLTLNCSAESEPAAGYKWTLGATELSNSSELSFVVQKSSESGNYTCHAANSVTQRTSSAVHALLVTEQSSLLRP